MRTVALFSLACLLIFTKCDDDVPEDNAIIVYNEDGIKIELVGVEDSRCPTIVECVRAGTARVDMKMFNDGDMESFTLYSNVEDGPQEQMVLGATVLLKKVDPYPQQPKDLNRPLEDYTVTVEVN